MLCANEVTICAGAKAISANAGAPELPRSIDIGIVNIDSAIAAWGYEPAVYALGSNSRVRGTRARDQLGWQPRHRSVTDWIKESV